MDEQFCISPGSVFLVFIVAVIVLVEFSCKIDLEILCSSRELHLWERERETIIGR